jgi:hypothetical protein
LLSIDAAPVRDAFSGSSCLVLEKICIDMHFAIDILMHSGSICAFFANAENIVVMTLIGLGQTFMACFLNDLVNAK